jgi:hypothetical protein
LPAARGATLLVLAVGRRDRLLLLARSFPLLTTIVMLNIGEGVIEAFVKPYLVTHGGIPKHTRAGLNVYFGIAFLFLIGGLISLGIAVIRAKVFPWWVGALFIASVPMSFVGQGLPGPLAEIGDYLAFLALITIGWVVGQPTRQVRRFDTNAEAAA